jgi:hypothetical protein
MPTYAVIDPSISMLAGTSTGTKVLMPSSEVSYDSNTDDFKSVLEAAPFYFVELAFKAIKPADGHKRVRTVIAEVVDRGGYAAWKAANEQHVHELADATAVDAYITADPDNWRFSAKLRSRPGVFSERVADNPDPLRKKMLAEVDATTRRLISQGFSYNAKNFSLSQAAQTTWLGMYLSRTSHPYPIEVNTIDDSDTELLEDDSDVEEFYAASVAAVRFALNSGTALKKQLNAATTEAEVSAVVDDR